MQFWFDNAVKAESAQNYQMRLGKRLTSTHPNIYRTFCFLVDAFELNKTPRVVSDEDFEAVLTKMLYRGDCADHLANLLVDPDYHKGDGAVANGIYAAHNILDAKDYSDNYRGDIIKFKLDPTANVIDLSTLLIYANALRHVMMYSPQSAGNMDELIERDLQRIRIKPQIAAKLKIIAKFCKKHSDDKELMKILAVETPKAKSCLAVLLGFDGIKTEMDYRAIINRGKIIVSQSEFERITEKSEAYRGGSIDFDAKTFLNE